MQVPLCVSDLETISKYNSEVSTPASLLHSIPLVNGCRFDNKTSDHNTNRVVLNLGLEQEIKAPLNSHKHNMGW